MLWTLSEDYNTKIKSKTTLDAVLALKKLGENNQVLIRWIPAHSGYLGNEKADTLAKRGANNTDATLLKLLIPKVTWDMAIRERTKHNIWTWLKGETHLHPTLRGYGGTSQSITLAVVIYRKPICSLQDSQLPPEQVRALAKVISSQR